MSPPSQETGLHRRGCRQLPGEIIFAEANLKFSFNRKNVDGQGAVPKRHADFEPWLGERNGIARDAHFEDAVEGDMNRAWRQRRIVALGDKFLQAQSFQPGRDAQFAGSPDLNAKFKVAQRP